MDVRRFDVAVIGAGTAGMEAHRRATEAGASACLIEQGPWGTTCVRVGCIPSKLLLAAGAAARAVREADAFGVMADAPRIDGRAVMARVRRERDHFLRSLCEKVEAIPAAQRIEGRARFVGPAILEVEGAGRVEAASIVIATGSRPAVPPTVKGFDSGRVLTTDTLFELDDLPASLAVLGAGALGVELALAMARLGVEVACFDKNTAPAGLRDEEVGAKAAALFRRELELHLQVEAEAEPDGEGARVRWKGDHSGERTFARVLCASGRTPNVDDLGLEASGLALGEDGVPKHDPKTGRCGESRIYIAGDADDDRPVLHEAAFQGRTAGGNAATGGAEPGPDRPAYALAYTDPDAAFVGEPLTSLGEDAVSAVFDDDRGRARIEARPGGLIKLWARRGGGPVLGGEMVGPGVEDLSQLLAVIVARRLTVEQALDLPFYHPTFAENLKGALQALGEALRG